MIRHKNAAFLRIVSFALLMVFVFSSCTDGSQPTVNNLPDERITTGLTEEKQTTSISDESAFTNAQASVEFRAVWLSYNEISDLVTEDEDSFYRILLDRFSSLNDWGLNTVIFHARAFGDAFYASEFFPWSSYLTGEQGISPGYDPLAVAVRAAHDAGLALHAWINPYRVSYQTDVQALSKTNPARIFAENGQQADLLQTESGIYYNPASLAAQQLILNGIREIVERYDVDGIHIDDYFYPSDVGDSDKELYDSYLYSGGKLSLNDWRKANVTSLVSGIYAMIKAIKPSVVFGISPSGMMDKNENMYYADVDTWISSSGYCDYIIPQIYFGYEHDEYPFAELVKQWSNACSDPSVSLYIGLALYKTGELDAYAGSETAQNEWIEQADLIARQIQTIRENKRCGGFALFSFADLFQEDEHKQTERQHLMDMLDGEG